MSSAPICRYTPAEYLARERKARTKCEFYRGEIFAMAGASREHNLIVANLLRVIGNALLEHPCEVYPSDMRVKIEETGLYTYPDLTIVCSEPQFEDAHFDSLQNPLVVFEVLAESTENYDRGAKTAQYRRLPSLRELVLIASHTVQVECYHRNGADQPWVLWETADLDAVLKLTAPEVTIPVAEVYRRVEFESNSATRV